MEREYAREGAVLVVEDNYALRVTLATVLEEAGYPVLTASHGQAALQLLRGPTRPALIILDLMLPITTGWEVLSALQADPVLAPIPVVVLSALADEPAGRLAAPVAAIVPKPVGLEAFLQVVAQAYPGTPRATS